MTNIAFLSFYSGIVERGVETFVYEVAKRLSRKACVTVFQVGQSRPQKFRTIQVKALASPPKSSKGILGKLYLDWQSLKILIFSILVLFKFFKEKYDVVIPLNGGWQMVLFRVVTKVIGSKILVSGHAGIGSDDAWNLLFRPDVFVALTSAQTQWAKKLVPEVQIVTISNGVDLARFNPKVKPKDVSLPEPIVVCASALVPYKRVDLTIRAIAKTKNFSLLVLGDGEQAGLVDSLGKRLLGRRYLRLVVSYEEIPSYYRAGKVFTLVSKTEAFGTSYIEAMACNLPVVTTQDPSRSEIIGDAGILTDPVNIHTYAKDLEIAAKTDYKNVPYMQALKFSWNEIARKYANVIDELVLEK